ncbi:MAG: trypsin-like peptidase domain-containing protein [Rhodobiaceae bacterium]|nr:trypsin-like peptidase domain-containing protein [Rhodobiaceae bacterium]MCC0047645.1 trypsin-like peptidase domain-containing protein [Rhodobiaceae bacterium]
MKRLAALCLCVPLSLMVASSSSFADDGAKLRSRAPTGNGPVGETPDPDRVARLLAAPLRTAPDAIANDRASRSGPRKLRAADFGTIGRSADGKDISAPPPEGTEQLISETAEREGQEASAKKKGNRAAPHQFEGGVEPVGDEAKNGQDRKVIGLDDRIVIEPTSKYPFSTVGYLEMEYSGSIGRCTGTVISRNIVITAAHCVYDLETNEWAKSVTFFPGLSGKSAPMGYFKAENWSIQKGYVDSTAAVDGNQVIHDMAIIEFSQDIGNTTGWLAVGYNLNLPPFVANIVQYPADKEGHLMWRSSCPVEAKDISEYFLTYECDTYGGSSGSSVYDYIDDNTRTIYAIHSRGNSEFNVGVRVTPMHFKWIVGKING